MTAHGNLSEKVKKLNLAHYIAITYRVILVFWFVFYCFSAAGANQENIVRMILSNEVGKKTISELDERGRNVFHYAVENHEILQYILAEHQEVR